MKKLLLSSVCAAALCASATALAADMPVKAPPMAAPMFSWTGCYIGGQAGYGWGKKDWAGTSGSGFLTTRHNVHGGLVGGQLGCNYQQPGSNWVVGIEASQAWANIKGHSLDGFTATTSTDASKVTSLGSLTGRLGWVGSNPQLLLYGKGGWAWDRDKFTNNFGGTLFSVNQSRTGWTAGAGAEWAFAPNWSAFVEYDHYDFGSKNVGPLDGDFTRIKQTVDTVKVGVNYRFDWGKSPVVARY